MSFKKVAFFISGGALLCSLLVPYIVIVFTSPQYPDKSPKIYLHANALRGDLNDWKVVGRYIGVNVEPELPEFDNNIVIYMVIVLAGFILISALLDDKVKKITSIILLSTGITIAGWAQFRLYQQGHNLDPTAPMRTVVKPFTPPLIGWTKVSKIKIYHLPHLGFILFGFASGLTVYTAWWKKN